MTEETTERKERMVDVILHYAVWDEHGVKHPAAPVVGVNAVGAPVRKAVTKLPASLAKRMVEDGKATVPLRD